VEKTNVLILTPSLHIGGLEMVIAHICRFIDKERFTIQVCCLKELGSIGNSLLNDGISVVALKKPKYLKNNYTSWLQVLTIVRSRNIHVVHSHTLDSLIDGALCKFGRRKLRLVHTFHFGNYPNIRSKYLYMETLFCRFADKLVAVGDEQKQKIRLALGIKDANLLTLLNGVPQLKRAPACALVEQYRRPGTVVVGTVCTLIEQKGLTDLLDVACLLKNRKVKAVYLVAGEGHLRKDLEDRIKALELGDDVVLLGRVDRAAEAFLPCIDIFFLPSLWEAMSVVVLEAMGAGKPVVVTNVGENRHVITDTVDGFLAEPRDVEALARIMEGLIQNGEVRSQVGARAELTIRTRFSVERMVSAYEQLYAGAPLLR
jgi:glycosyltransferase involved in cell wall biosynthesis